MQNHNDVRKYVDQKNTNSKVDNFTDFTGQSMAMKFSPMEACDHEDFVPERNLADPQI